MYRSSDPRFRRRLNEIGQTVEQATESAQSTLYNVTQNYVKPCFESISSCVTTCVDASCPTLNVRQSRIRRQQRRGRAELSFDFYDDWDEDETDALMGWGNDEFDRLLAGSGGYGTVSHTQPARQRGMSYPKGRRKSAVQPHDGGPDPTVIPGSNFFGKLFGAKALRYRPSAADLQEHPGARRSGRDRTEGEALLAEHEEAAGKRHRRIRSSTVTSGHTTDSLSSRGDIFPSDEEDDAIPLDDEFAMVLERRTTQSGGGGPDTETSSGRTRNSAERRRRGKRPSAGSRTSTRRTLSSRGSSNGRKSRSRTNSSAAQTPIEENSVVSDGEGVSMLNELKREEREVAREEEEDVERRRLEAQKLAAERGLPAGGGGEDLSSKEATPAPGSPIVAPLTERHDDEPSQLPTPLATDDEQEPDRHFGDVDKGQG